MPLPPLPPPPQTFHRDAAFAKPSIMFGWCLAAHQVGAATAAASAGAVRTHAGDYNAAFWFSGGVCMVAALLVLQINKGGVSSAARTALRSP
jgi:predicted MFS family arabinose efflux permease